MKTRLIQLAAFLAVVAVVALIVDVPDLAALRQWRADLGPWFVAALWGAYVVFTLFPIPRTIWTVASGVLLGPWQGLALSLSALTVSACITVVGLRTFLGRFPAPSNPTLHLINEHLERRGWVAIFNLRMIAGIPFSLLNYAAALTAIPLGQFAVATLIGSIPTTALGVFFGDALTGQTSPWIIAAMVALALLGFTGLVRDYLRATRIKSTN